MTAPNMMQTTASGSPSLTPFDRWWRYQKERFPLLKYGGLIAIFSGSAVCYSALLHPVTRPSLSLGLSWLLAFVNVFCFFVQIRIADEFKDFEDDRRYRPDRPVPSGLVSLKELGTLGVLTALLQVGLALWLMPQAVGLLALVWGYFGLMCAEFFVRDWLKAHPIVYMLSHLVILPLIALYATAWDWGLHDTGFSIALMPLFATCFLNGIVFEIGRKIRAPEDEQFGVQTYSALWQPTRAVWVWLAAMGGTAISAIVTAYPVQSALPVGAIVLTLWMLAAVTAYRFLRRPDAASAKAIDGISGVWTLGLYFSLGLLPFILTTLIHATPLL